MKQTPESQEAVRRIALQARSEKANRKAIESTISHKAKRTKPVERPGIVSYLCTRLLPTC